METNAVDEAARSLRIPAAVMQSWARRGAVKVTTIAGGWHLNVCRDEASRKITEAAFASLPKAA